MRAAFVDALSELAREDDRIFLLTADLGWSVVERFAREFPDRFLNVGVAEANMAGIATGLAQSGLVPFLYSIATFASMRCYEQLRNGPVIQGLPVRLIGIGGGFAYGHAGATHYAVEDLALARVQPGMTVLVPADPLQTRAVVRATAALPGAVYMRVGKGGNPPIPALRGRFELGRPEVVREGKDLLLLTCGAIATEALAAAGALEPLGLSPAVAIMAHLPLEGSAALRELLGRSRAVVSVEEGSVTGGLGSLVAETIALHGLGCRLWIAGVRDPLGGISGTEPYMRARHALDAAGIAGAARKLMSSLA